MKKILLLLYFLIRNITLNAQIETVSNYSFNGNNYNSFVVEIDSESIKKFTILENDSILRNQEVLTNLLKKDSSFFLINACISDTTCTPIGYFVKNSQTIQPVNLKDGSGNFYLKPNGALLFTQNDAIVCESSQISNYHNVRLGVQSGPMLLNNGAINPQFNEKSNNKNIRCGVGIFTNNNSKKNLVFCISNNPVSFYDFAVFFNKKFKCNNALCLESVGCSMYFPNPSQTNDKFNGYICNYFYLNIPANAMHHPVTKVSGPKTVIKMKKVHGVYQIPTEIDGVPMSFIFDTGAGLISISVTEASFLYKQGKLTDNDIIGTTNFVDANGDISEGTIINLKTVTIGSRVLQNVEASVVHNISAPLLMGQSALEMFGKISIDYQKEEITLE